MKIDVGHGVNAHKIVSEDNTMYILENTREADLQDLNVEDASTADNPFASAHVQARSRVHEQEQERAPAEPDKPLVTRNSSNIVSPNTTATSLALKRLRDQRRVAAGGVQAAGINYEEDSGSDTSLSFGSGSDSEDAQEGGFDISGKGGKRGGDRVVALDKGKGKAPLHLPAPIEADSKSRGRWADASEDVQLAWALAQSRKGGANSSGGGSADCGETAGDGAGAASAASYNGVAGAAASGDDVALAHAIQMSL